MGLFLIFVCLLSMCCCVSLPPSFGNDAAKVLTLSANSTHGFERLTFWVDSVGHRISGSASLQAGLDLAKSMLQGLVFVFFKKFSYYSFHFAWSFRGRFRERSFRGGDDSKMGKV